MDIAPLIDVVFILLIFFLVTTSFLRDTGLDVELPQATQARSLDPGSLRVAISAGGMTFTEGRALTLEQLAARVRTFVAEKPEGMVILLPDRELPSGRLVEVMDRAKAAGATVSIAANSGGVSTAGAVP